MAFVPTNRHLLVEHVTQEQEQEQNFGILLPEDYKPVESPYVAVRVVDWDRQKVGIKLEEGCTVIVNRSMVEEIPYRDETFHVVLENYVVGTLTAALENTD